jgi:predicted amidohydrolase
VTRIVCHQLAPVIGELDRNCDTIVASVTAAVTSGADVVVLPELATSGYVFESLDEARSLAIGPDHDVFARVATALAGTSAVAVFGFCEQGQGDVVHNSAAVVAADGVQVVYRKTHLWDTEKRFFSPGVSLPPVVDTAVGRIGVLVCYDLEFPEMTRHLALHGAELIVVPTNWPAGPRPAGERPVETIIAMAAARTNRVVIACCDRTGTERGQEWTAGTTIVDYEGWIAATCDADGIATAELDLVPTRDKRISTRNDLLGDRRTDLY